MSLDPNVIVEKIGVAVSILSALGTLLGLKRRKQ